MSQAALPDPLDRAIEAAGGMALLAKLLQEHLPEGDTVTRQAVYQWRMNGIPPLRAKQVEIALQGQVTREELCPEVFN